MKCPKCDYERQHDDVAPDYECPKCGIIYANYNPNSPANLLGRKLRAKSENIDCVDVINDRLSEGDDIQVQFGIESGGDKNKNEPVGDELVHIPGNLAVCQNCEEVGRVIIHMPGSNILEIVLFLCYLVPGIIYAVWRRQSKKQVCGACGSDRIVAAKTRVGLSIISSQYPSYKIERVEVGPRYVLKPGSKLVSRTLWMLSIIFAISGVSLIFSSANAMALMVYQFVFSAFFAIGALYSAKPKKVEVNSVGQGLVGW